MIDAETFKKLGEYLTTPAYQREDSFANSLAYYALTGRRGAFVCENETAKAVMCHHPNRNDHILIFPEIGHGDGRLIADIIKNTDTSKQTLQLARFTIDEITAVQNHLMDNTSITLRTGTEEHLDWQYPIHILDTQAVATLSGSDFRNVRNKIKKINPADIEMIKLDDPHALKYLRACTKYWEGNQILYDKPYQDGDSAFYDTLCDQIEENPDMFDGFILKYKGRISSFSIWDNVPGAQTANFLANLVDVQTPGLSEYQLVTTCRLLHDNGVPFLNRGGSEGKGLDNFKRKFAPIKTIPLHSATIERNPKRQFSFMPLIQNPKNSANHLFA